MKILYILDWPINLVGGAQKSTYTIAVEMQKLGNKVFICCPQLSGNWHEDEIEYYFHNIKGNSYKEKILKIQFYKKLFAKQHFDIVHIQNPSSFSIIGLMLKFRIIKNNKTKFIFTDRDFYSAYKMSQKLLFSFIYNKFEYIICTTILNRKQWEKVTDKVLVIPNVLDQNWYEYDEDRSLKNRIKNNNVFTIGFCGRFVEYKRWDTVYEICNLLKNRNIAFMFAFGTANERENANLKIYLQKLDHIIPNKYTFIKNANQQEMMDFYYTIDCFVLTSNRESFGRTLLEAMTKKCVVVGTNSGGVPEVIGNPEFLFEVGQAKDAVKIIEKYSNCHENIKWVQEYFYTRVNNTFSRETMINSHMKIYINMLRTY